MQTIIELEHISYKEALERKIDRLLRLYRGQKFAGMDYDKTIREADKAAKALGRLTNFHAGCLT
jgi:hypothetical protein